MRYRVNVDWDNVVGDFDGHCRDRFGETSNNLTFDCPQRGALRGNEALWAHVDTDERFWLDIPLFFHAQELISICRPYGVRFITGCPRTGYDRAERDKLIKSEQEFPGVPMITCRSDRKQNHMQEPGDILVDDSLANISRWKKAGGYGVEWHSYRRSMEDLKAALRKQFPEIEMGKHTFA